MNRPNKYWDFIVDFFLLFIPAQNCKHETMTRVFLMLWDSVRWFDGNFSYFHHWKVFFVIFNKEHFVGILVEPRGKVNTSSLELKIFAILIARNVHARVGVFLFALNRHQQCGKNAVKITYYLHTNIFQLFSCQVSISFDRLAAFRELCDIAFNIYFYISNEIKPIIRIHKHLRSDCDWACKTKMRKIPPHYFLLLFYLSTKTESNAVSTMKIEWNILHGNS